MILSQLPPRRTPLGVSTADMLRDYAEQHTLLRMAFGNYDTADELGALARALEPFGARERAALAADTQRYGADQGLRGQMYGADRELEGRRSYNDSRERIAGMQYGPDARRDYMAGQITQQLLQQGAALPEAFQQMRGAQMPAPSWVRPPGQDGPAPANQPRPPLPGEAPARGPAGPPVPPLPRVKDAPPLFHRAPGRRCRGTRRPCRGPATRRGTGCNSSRTAASSP